MATRRQDIAQVAARVIADEGLERASMREIAGQMGVTIGTLTASTEGPVEDLVVRPW